MFFKQSAQQDTLQILLTENKRLKQENQRLRTSLHELEGYKDEYDRLIASLDQLKVSYKQKLKEFDNLKNQYKKELDKLLKQAN
ncbi:MAG: hypothetical protein HFI84_11745 [Eubacterium sp.]|nr:hypothetical protein [Eubacterium sp.]